MECPGRDSHSKSKHNCSADLSNASPCKNPNPKKQKQIAFTITSKSKQKSNNKSKPKSLTCSHIKQSQSKLKTTNTRHKTLEQQQSSKSLKQLKKQQIESYDKKIRNQNKKYINRENSSENLQMRLAWGIDQSRLNNYVLTTLAKMQKLRKTDCQKKQQTFNTDKSEILKESDIKLQLTPKRIVENQEKGTKNQKKIHQKIIKSPTYAEEQKTNKKIRQPKKEKFVSPQKKTQKQCKKIQQEGESTQKSKQVKLSDLLSKSLTGQFQCLEKNNFYSLNFRVVNKKILQIQLAFGKKAQSVTVNLNKGSLECQSINQTYQNVSPKSSIILMTAVSGVQKTETFIYPELQIMLNEKGGNFSLQKKIILPYNQLFLLQTLSNEQLKYAKLPSKIKNKSIIEQILYSKQILLRMQRIFSNNFLKYKIKEHLFYLYGFKYLGEMSLIRVIVNGNKCILECEGSSGANTKQVLEMFLPVLGI